MKRKNLYNKVDKQILKEKLLSDRGERLTLSFYVYANIADPKQFRDDLYEKLDHLQVFGRIYVAQEGINAQISVPSSNLNALKKELNHISFLKGVRLNIAVDDNGQSFYKLKIKIRPKIVADGLNDDAFDITKKGRYLDARGFNELTKDPQTIVVDMRNHYESEVGHFEGAILPDVETFREALPTVEKILRGNENKNIILYCTGGIRCEKASAYFKYKGFEKIHQLEGGIIEYTRQVRQQDLHNKFKGKNFVFDERMGERIGAEIIARCHQCGKACDNHINCANDACHILFIQCENCASKYGHCCSLKCKEFIQLPVDEQKARRKAEIFNGTKFGKGRYKAHRNNEML